VSEDFSKISARLLAAHVQQRRPRVAERDQGIAVVARAIVEQSRKRRRRRVLSFGAALGAAAAVAVVAGFLGAQQATSGEPQAALASPVQVGLVDGRRFEPGQTLAAGEGRATVVEFGRAARVWLDAKSELEYRQGDATRRFGLLSGAVHLRVGKLQAGQRFLVETPDAEVEVRGTAFHVALSAPGQGCASPRTRVAVDEGVVEVRFQGASYRVHPGEHWPARCNEQPQAEHAPAPAPQALPVPEPRSSPKRSPRKASELATSPLVSAEESAKRQPEPTPKQSPSPALALTEQNNAYAKAVAARRAGRLPEALAAFEQFLERFPGSALSESAQAERLRLVIRLRPSQSKTEAARYLSRYPSGLASAEARALLGAP
jgi:ferric-dicitrate binding protein FerR (iron transport regulator)